MSLTAILEDRNPWWRDPAIRAAARYPARRDFQRRLLTAIGASDRRAQVVLGPRQVGKTVALLQLADDLVGAGWPPGNITYFDFSDDRLTEPVSPREIADLLPPRCVRDRPRVLLLDEVSRAPRWAEWLKQVVDAGAPTVVATDSAASIMRRRATESGQGRWDEVRVEGLTFAEYLRFLASSAAESPESVLRRVPNALERYLTAGGFPEHAFDDDAHRARDRLRSDIVDRAIARDLAELGVQVEGVRRLFVYLARDSGAIFSARERARDLDVDERSVKSWVERLADAQLIRRLERHTRRATASLRSKPKLYVVDHGLVVAFASSAAPLDDPGVRGRTVEAVVFRHLRSVQKADGTIWFFRSDRGLEADFVIAGEGRPVVVEATSQTTVERERVKSVRQVGDEIGTDRLVIAYRGLVEEVRDGVRVLPLALM